MCWHLVSFFLISLFPEALYTCLFQHLICLHLSAIAFSAHVSGFWQVWWELPVGFGVFVMLQGSLYFKPTKAQPHQTEDQPGDVSVGVGVCD